MATEQRNVNTLPDYDADCCLLNTTDSKIFLNVQAEIARIAVSENFGKLPVSLVEIYNGLKEKNEARFEEWIGGANA